MGEQRAGPLAELFKTTDDPAGTIADEDGNGYAPDGSRLPEEHPADGGGDLVVEGTGQLTFDVGGKAPTSSSVRLTGGKVDVEGSFAKGELVALRVEAVVGEVSFIDQRDEATRQVVGSERRHKLRIVGIARDVA